jgi:hypothetical protein
VDDIFEFIAQIFIEIFFNVVCMGTGEIFLFAATLSQRQPDFKNPSGWSPWIGLALWIGIATVIVFALIALRILKF